MAVAAVFLLALLAAAAGADGAQELDLGQVMYSNLGGKGPDTKALHGIRFTNVAEAAGERIDMIVLVAGQETDNAYSPGDVNRNGEADLFARISVAGGTSVQLIAKFFEPRTARLVEMESFYFTIYGIDSKVESVLISGFDELCTADGTAVSSTGNSSRLVLTPSADSSDTGEYASPTDLTSQQLKQTVSFVFKGAATFPLLLSAADSAGPVDFLFSGAAVNCAASSSSETTTEEVITDAETTTVEMTTTTTLPSTMTSTPSTMTSTVTTTTAFDCTASNVATWSQEMQELCCRTSGMGCPVKETFKGANTPVKTCEGEEKQTAACPNLPPCEVCNPVDCLFGEWSVWQPRHDCTGLCQRNRTVLQTSNECGKLCDGPLTETSDSSDCLPDSCTNTPVDCQWGSWVEWSDCLGSGIYQSYRYRERVQREQNGGTPCEGPWNETEPCGGPEVKDCELSAWGEWTQCSESCGGGWKAQMRRIKHYAEHGGKPCENVTRHTLPCNTQPCGEQLACNMSNWTKWVGCNGDNQHQRFRSRVVLSTPQTRASQCDHAVEETAPCPVQAELQASCVLAPWTTWSACSATCEGQSFRGRSVKEGQGACMLEDKAITKETMACGASRCHEVQECETNAWSGWGPCSKTCGMGEMLRTRNLLDVGASDGFGCVASLKEVKSCEMPECEASDCTWADWNEWGACTATCGGGSKRRSRVVQDMPQNGGEACEAKDKAEVIPCNTGPCNECIDGAWGEWNEWSGCATTCGSSVRARHRQQARHANRCGKSAVGLEDEYEVCESTTACEADVNCELSEWTSWSDCSSDCFGVHESTRTITTYASGNGKPCANESLRWVEPCNPATNEAPPLHCGPEPKISCMMASWDEWSVCSASCDGGQKSRGRKILTPNLHDGLPCNSTTTETAACNVDLCSDTLKCIDCEWGDWSHWGGCTYSGGQHYRHRQIKRMPNICGAKCEPTAAKEVSNCTSAGEKKSYCVWSKWASLSDCSTTCGHATKMMQRQLTMSGTPPQEGGESAFFSGDEAVPCSGWQVNVTACPYAPCDAKCQAVNCKFQEWTEWSKPSCSTQLCERERLVGQYSQCGGIPCGGPLSETKHCPVNCTESQDCQLSHWSAWDPNECEQPGDQRTRHRNIIQQAANGGEACHGPLKETMACVKPPSAVDDAIAGSWSEWSECSRTCGGGEQKRERDIAYPARNGGEPFSGPLGELQPCNTQKCEDDWQPCVMEAWSKWSACREGSLAYRHRKVEQEPGLNGMACGGSLREVKTCEIVVDCKVSGWTEWDPCDKSCGGGQKQRHRQVVKNPQNGGKLCPSAILQTTGCNAEPCEVVDAEVDDWSKWSPCSTPCGIGERNRTRSILTMPEEGGRGFNGELAQTEPCEATSDECSPQDCLWSTWSRWSDCTAECEGGQQSRNRTITQLPKHGGKACAAHDSDQIRSCNTQKCAEDACVDGEWDEWLEWAECSQTCSGGMTFRTREVKREANDCGQAVLGLSTQTASCNSQVECESDRDCEFGDWSVWTNCSSKCLGLKARTREIAKPGEGHGKFCSGPLKQTWPCQQKGAECGNGMAVDCTTSEWSEWGMCDAECGDGQSMRTREVLTEPASGGLACNGSLTETQPCQAATPCTPECLPVDCVWSPWSAWSACEKCGGQKRRFRNVATYPSCGGQLCSMGMAEEIEECPRSCHQPVYCAWATWSPFAGCSATCGSGTQTRTRSLVKSSVPPPDAVAAGSAVNSTELEYMKKFEELHQREHGLQARRVQELVLAWAAGCVSLIAAFGVWKALTGSAAAARRLRRRGDGDYEFGMVAQEREPVHE